MSDLEQELLRLFNKYKNLDVVSELMCMKKQDIKRILNKLIRK